MATIEGYGLTDMGLVRTNNEDAFFFDPDLCVALVADGMGGAACGEVASGLTVETIVSYLRQAKGKRSTDVAVLDAIREANRQVIQRTRQEAQCKGMGSTIVAAQWELPHLFIVNVGDSRAYLWRGSKLEQLSYDQTLVNELRRRMELTEAQVQQFPHKNVLTMAIGSADDLMICTRDEVLQPSDMVLLCSDGLSGPVSDEEIAQILADSSGVREKVDRMVEAAKAAGGPDNITVVLLAYVE